MKIWLGNLKMTSKLMVSPLTAVAFLVIFGIVCYTGFLKQKGALDDAFDKRLQTYELTAGILVDINKLNSNALETINMMSSAGTKANTENRVYQEVSESAFQQYAVDGSAIDITNAITKVKTNMLQLSKSSLQLTKAEKEYVDRTQGNMNTYIGCIQAGMDSTESDASVAQAKMLEGDSYFKSMSQDLQDLLSLESKLGKEQRSSASLMFKFVMISSVVVFLAAVILPFGISLIMKALILKPIHKTVTGIEAVARGDLTTRIEVESRDEIGEMANHFNQFAETLGVTITHVVDSSNRVASAAALLDEAAERMAAGAEEAAMQLNAVAAASEEMPKTTDEIARNCVMAVRSSEEADKTVKTGEAIVQDTIRVMSRISERVKDSSKTMRRLGERSDQIGEIVSLVNDVADQTNLLALNAPIEAARAGEHGRGFAVVADEVRKLAERTGHATKEISETISAMQADTRKAITSMEEGVADVGSGTKEAAKSGEALKGILLQINKVTEEINQIAVASEQETSSTNEIATSIQQISQVMQETAHQIQGNANASSELADLSTVLKEMIGHFKLA